MAELHGLASMAVLGVAVLLAGIAGVAAGLDRGHRVVVAAAVVATAAFGVQAVLGLATMLLGAAPGDGLHLLYGLALVATIPLGLSFAGEAPPRARSGVIAAAAVVALLLSWRLFATG